MSAASTPHRQRRATPSRRWATVEALALALLLLITQQWGLSHALQHRAAGAGAAQVAALPGASHAADAADAAIDLASDASPDNVCAVCLALAGLGSLALPQLAAWAAAEPPATLPAERVARSWHRTAPAPFQARAPPVLS